MEDTTQKDQLKRARRVALVLATVSTICILLFMFGQIQRIEAEKNRTIADQLRKELENQKTIAEQNEQIAKANEFAALQALEDCQKKNNK